MAYRTRNGLADVVHSGLNPTQGTALDCGLFAFGVFRPECWCLSFPSLCSKSDYVAAQAMAHPEVYDTLKQPPTVGTPTGAALTTPPASGQQAQQTVDTLIGQQVTDWQTQNLASMQQVQSNLDTYEQETQKTKWWVIAALAGVGIIAFGLMGGRRR